MSAKSLTINCPDGSFSGYLASPPSGQGPAIIVIQEIFGVNAVMRETCDALASEGFFAFSPDLFWRMEPGIDITDKTEAEWARAFELFNTFDVDMGIEDISASIDTLKELPGCTGHVGAVGYCLGGLLAYLTAARTSCDASVGYYGVNIQEKLDEKGKISAPLMLHIAEKDEFVPPEAQEKIKNDLSGLSNVTLHSYPGLDHAFARQGGKHFNQQYAGLANDRTLQFFQQHLG
jgi:carboxymethylenebutenolidase